MERLYLGIDQGSSSTKGVLLDAHGQHYHEFNVNVSARVDGDQVEQSPVELLSSIRFVADEAIRLSHRLKRSLSGIGISCQRSGVCAWVAHSGDIVHPVITHRDTRTKEMIESIREQHPIISERSGMPVTPRYAAGKIAMLQERFGEAEVTVGTLDSFLVQQLTGDTRFVTEDSMAARTMLYNLELGRWDSELCAIFGVAEARLASISPSLGQHGTYRGVPVTAMLGDQQASLFGRWCEGLRSVLNLGTISSICVGTDNEIIREQGFATSVFYSEGAQREFQYLIEAVTNCSGAISELLIAQMHVCSDLAGLDALCAQAGDKFPIAYFSMGSTGTPEWKSDLPNVIRGWDKLNQASFARALLENVANFIAQNLRTLEARGLLVKGQKPIAVSGGLSDIDYLLQYLADVSGFEFVRLASREASARGAAVAAMTYLSKAKRPLTIPRDREQRLFAPQNREIANERFERWRTLQAQVFNGDVDPATVFEGAVHDVSDE